MARKGKRPSRGQSTEAQQNNSDKGYNRSETEREAPSDYNPSGHFDPREPRSSRGRAKKLAMGWAFQSVGDASYWEEYIEEAKERVEWNDYVKWLKRKKGYEYIESYPYPNPEGSLLYEVCRFEYALLRRNKLFIPRHKEDGKWVRFMPPVRVPYNLPELLKRLDEEITLVEGEKGANALMAKGILATCIHGQQWTNEAVEFFTDRTVNIAMDNDKSGRAHIETAREWLSQVNATMRVIELPGLPPGKGLDDWLEIHSVEEYRELVAKTKPERTIANLKVINPADWVGQPVPERIFLVPPLIPHRNVALLYGDGGLGKSLLALDLARARATKGSWLGLKTLPGKTLVLSAEDDLEELHRRLDTICLRHKVSLGDLSDMRLIDLVGQDAVIGELSRNGRIVATELYHFMLRQIADFAPSLVIVDALADSFAGDENNRIQARQFISMLRNPAITYNCAFLAVPHPSLSGIASGRGTSGTTGWSNSVRARMYLETVEIEGAEPDPSLKVLRQPKANYACAKF